MSSKAIYNFDGITCVVTGGASGIGLAFAEGLAGFGANVIMADINISLARKSASEIMDKGCRGSVYPFELDATSPESAERLAKECIERFGKVDALVNSIGVGAKPKPEESPYDIWERIVRVNLHGVYNCCIALGEAMIKAGGGKIINVASVSAGFVPEKTRPGRGGEYGLLAYTSSKGGVRQLTRALAVLWAPYGIVANSISPGYVNTPLTAEPHSNPDIAASITGKVPLRRIAEPDDIVGAVYYLISDDSTYVTGHDLVIDGGFTCQ